MYTIVYTYKLYNVRYIRCVFYTDILKCDTKKTQRSKYKIYTVAQQIYELDREIAYAISVNIQNASVIQF